MVLGGCPARTDKRPNFDDIAISQVPDTQLHQTTSAVHTKQLSEFNFLSSLLNLHAHDKTMPSTFFKTIALLSLLAPFVTVMAADDQLQPTCGVAGDATLSDCQTLVNSGWSNFDYSRTCHFRNSAGLPSGQAWNPICSPGNCCIYVANDGYKSNPDALKAAVQKILGCQDAAKNKVNGAMPAAVGQAFSVCVSDGKGCGDCFDAWEDPHGGEVAGIYAPDLPIERRVHIRGQTIPRNVTRLD